MTVLGVLRGLTRVLSARDADRGLDLLDETAEIGREIDTGLIAIAGNEVLRRTMTATNEDEWVVNHKLACTNIQIYS